jgi:hypothetical protein
MRTIWLVLMCFASSVALAADDAPRAARSVHLSYIAAEATAFYNEVVVEQSQRGSYFMACGFTGGYFGIQEYADGQKVILFSVWDPDDKQKDAPGDKLVRVLYQSPQAKVQRFGGEGTGEQCIVKFDWKTGERYCFFIQATVTDAKTAYAAYFRPAMANKWLHLATFERESNGAALKGLYSFIEDFRRDYKSANETRRARFGESWIVDKDKNWTQLTKAKFTASNATWEAKETIDAGSVDDWFYLQTGGKTHQHNKLGDAIERALSKSEHPEFPPN